MINKQINVLYFVVILMFSVLMFSCNKDESYQKTPAQNINPYTNESVFVVIKNKLKENPNDVDSWYHLADLYNRNGQYAEAIEAYKNVIKLKPNMGYAYFKMGTAYDRLNQPAEAVVALKNAIKYMPDYAVAYNNLGVAYGKLGKIDREIKVLSKAIKLRPRYASARYNLGIAYLKSGNKKAAKQQYEALKNIDNGIADALLKEINKTPQH